MNLLKGKRLRVHMASVSLGFLKMEISEWLHRHIYNSVKRDKMCVSLSVCQRSPTQVIKHAGNTLIWGIVVLHPSPLNHFNFIDNLFSVWRPNRRNVFNLGTLKAIICQFFYWFIRVLTFLLTKPRVLLAFAVILSVWLF